MCAAKSFSLREPQVRCGYLLLAYECDGLDGQLPDSAFRIVAGKMTTCKNAQSLGIRTTEKHRFRFQELEFRCPFGIGELEFFVPLLGFPLTVSKSSVLEEYPNAAIRSLSAAAICVVQRNEQQE